ncbi:MAG: TolC family protein [Bacteroidales bacterium]|nr:TolC family protein [Bacteroidales bacterium]
MNLYKSLLLGVVITFTSNGYSQELDETQTYNFTLEDCLQYAMGNSLQRQSLLLSEQSTEAQYQQSKKNKLPSVSASAGETMSHSGTNNSDIVYSGNVGVNASMTLYQGGNIKNTIEQNRLQSEKQKVQTSQYDDNLTIQILNQYLTALSCKERLNYQGGIMESSRQQLARGEKRFEVGAIIESDYLLLKAQYESDKADSLNSAISLENALLNLKQLMSMDPDAILEIQAPDTSTIAEMALLPNQSDVVVKAKEHMPDMILAKSTVEIANTTLEIAKSGRRPTVTASASVGTRHNDFENMGDQLKNSFNQSLGVNVSIPIFDRGSNKLQVTRSKIQQQQAELDLAQTEIDISRTVVNQYRATTLEYQRYLAYETRKDAYSKSFGAYQKRFEVGSLVAVELLQQQNNYINVLNEYINAKYSFILNRKILDVYTGEAMGF